MSLRDYFAAKAMQAIFAGHGAIMVAHRDGRYDETNWAQVVAMNAYEMADAMIAQRQKGGVNALLIAAAPDLLESAKAINALAEEDEVNPDEFPRWWPAYEALRAAIAKAEGSAATRP